jgi:hypothetical protein
MIFTWYKSKELAIAGFNPATQPLIHELMRATVAANRLQILGNICALTPPKNRSRGLPPKTRRRDFCNCVIGYERRRAACGLG